MPNLHYQTLKVLSDLNGKILKQDTCKDIVFFFESGSVKFSAFVDWSRFYLLDCVLILNLFDGDDSIRS